MACNCGRKRITVYAVEYADGTVKRVLTQGEASQLAQESEGAVYRAVTR